MDETIKILYAYLTGRLHHYSVDDVDFLDDYDRAEYDTLTEIKEFIEVQAKRSEYERSEVD